MWRAGHHERASETTALAGLGAAGPRLRWESAVWLGRHPQRSSTAIAALIDALADPEEIVRWQAAEALAAQETDRVFPALAQSLEDPDPLRRAGAAEAIGGQASEAAVLTLAKHVDDPDPQVRIAVASALGRIGDVTAVSALIPLLDDGDPNVRRAVAGALGRIASPAIAASLAARLMQPDQPLLVRRALAAALVRAPHHDAQAALLQALHDPDGQVRGYAAQALGQVGDDAACAALRDLCRDYTPILHGSVADNARQALALLGRHGHRLAAESPAEQ